MNYSEKYSYLPDDALASSRIDSIMSSLDDMSSPEVLKRCFSLMDLTTLHSNDTVGSVKALVSKVNSLKELYPDYPLPASVCVYPNFASVVRDAREDAGLHVTTVSACFPSSQSYLEVKLRECELAVLNGADEVDIVLNLGAFFAGDYDTASTEIQEVRKVIDAAGARDGRKIVLKVILETGLLKTSENIANASFLAMEAGADFIKTSTGKVEINATPQAAYVMCGCILAFWKKTGRKVGFKAAGGISDARAALCYYFIGKTVLGEEWLDKEFFRFGVSRLGNSLMSAIEQKTVSFF